MQKKRGKFKINWGGTDLKLGVTVLASLAFLGLIKKGTDFLLGFLSNVSVNVS